MDRQLTTKEKNKMRHKKVLRIGVPVVGLGLLIWGGITLSRPEIDRNKIIMGTVDRGMVQTAVNASGRVVPAFEQIISSPISAKIVEVFCRPGDIVDEGTALLSLDLNAAETEINKLRDSRQKQVYAIEQQRLSNETQLNNLRMQIKVKEMNVDLLEAEAVNERRLDSIGSGTGDKVREAELACRTARIELEQLRLRLENETKELDAKLQSQLLDLSISDKNLEEQLRLFEGARLKSPRKATLTYINSNIGQMVAQGEKVAMIADLGEFKIDAETAENNGKYLAAGGRAFVKISRNVYPARLVEVSPVSNQGAVHFSVILDSDSVKLQPGLSAEVGVIREVKDDVLRIPMGAIYSGGSGEYEVFVEEKPGELVKRRVLLGDASYEYIEVVSGLKEGDRVVLSNTGSYKNSKYKLIN